MRVHGYRLMGISPPRGDPKTLTVIDDTAVETAAYVGHEVRVLTADPLAIWRNDDLRRMIGRFVVLDVDSIYAPAPRCTAVLREDDPSVYII